MSTAAATVVVPTADIMECGVCWWVYDPGEGDDLAHIAPGTAFANLPDDWTCPECEAAKHRFLRPSGGAGEAESIDEDIHARVADLVAAYRTVHETSMNDVPICHPDLDVEAVGFERIADPAGLFGVVITPWFLNLVLWPDLPQGRNGEKLSHAFPAGNFEFVIGGPEGFESLQSCSLFSPMSDFADQAAARETAEKSLQEVMRPLEAEAPVDEGGTPLERPKLEPSRRDFLRGRVRG